MEYFIEQALIVLPVLGVSIFRSLKTQPVERRESAEQTRDESPIFEIASPKNGMTALATEVDGEFTVLEGSSARKKWVGGPGHPYESQREQLERDGILVDDPNGDVKRFTRDYVFASPSAAAAAVWGRGSNGRTEWKVRGTGKTYGEWQSEGVDAVMAEKLREA